MRILSGIQTSGNGELHIGNYLGAIKQWIELQNDNEAYYMLANLHAITAPLEPSVAHENIYKITALYLALGIDPQKSTIFAQSQVPQHTELAWLLNTIAYMGELRRMTQFKDKGGEDQETASVGLFDYPVLQAADILLYQADRVPVGEDQKQHLELTRNLAERFNNRYGQTFKIPEPHIPQDAARIMGIDNPIKKMSKSLGENNYISLIDDPPKIREKMKRAVTDSENEVRLDREQKPAISNLLIIFSAVSGRPIEDLAQTYATAGYGRFKDDLAEALIQFLTPIQKNYHHYVADRGYIDRVLADGATKAQAAASVTLTAVKQKMGIV